MYRIWDGGYGNMRRQRLAVVVIKRSVRAVTCGLRSNAELELLLGDGAVEHSCTSPGNERVGVSLGTAMGADTSAPIASYAGCSCARSPLAVTARARASRSWSASRSPSRLSW